VRVSIVSSREIQEISAHFGAGRFTEARDRIARILKKAPGHPEANNAMALALLQLGDAAGAERHARIACEVSKNNPGLMLTLGMALNHQRKVDESVRVFRAILELDPANASARQGLNMALVHQDRLVEAIEVLSPALRGGPPDVAVQLSTQVVRLGRADEAVELLTSALADTLHHGDCARALAATILYANVHPERVRAAHELAGRSLMHEHRGARTRFPNTPDPERPLRVGLLSGDFRSHSVMYFLLPILERLSRESWSLHAYSTNTHDDKYTAKVRELCASYTITRSPDFRSDADRIAGDRIDILLDLGGHTETGRAPIVCLKPAPLVVSYLGYPFSTGLPTVDARIVDATTDPRDAERYAFERLVRLDKCFLCYRPPMDAPPVASSPCAERGHITFGSFNSFMKVTPVVLDAWARVLSGVPGSRLALKGQVFNDPRFALEVRGEFDKRGIAPERLDLLAFAGSTAEHLAAYSRVDIALDTFPYAGTTTTCEAMWMGVPVVTLRGVIHPGRVGASLLQSVGHPEWIAEDLDAYVALATRLAGDPAGLAKIRGDLRKRLEFSTLMDEPPFVERFDACLRGLWRDWCAKNPPTA
jgi:predicted O-linked N-acetylglucosamine transferase (SPINDLY family)